MAQLESVENLYSPYLDMPYNAGDIRSKTFGSNRIPPEKIIAYIEANFEFKTRKGGSEYIINNPLNYDDGYHFNINPIKGTCHDWRGNEWAGPINPSTNSRNCSFVKFIRLYKKCSYSEAIKAILGTHVDIRHYLNPKFRVTDEGSKNKFSVQMPEAAQPITESDDLNIKILVKWLKSRGYTLDSIIKNNLHYLGMDVFWPYYEFDTLVYWQSRSRLKKRFEFPSLDVFDNNGKVIGQTDGSKGDYFYAFDDVEPASYVMITEAIFDQHTLGEQTLASGGAVLTTKQINKLKVIGPMKGVILSPDRDIAGIESVLQNGDILTKAGYKVFFSIPPDVEYKDSDGSMLKVKDWNELGMHVCGFNKVRSIHDSQISKLDAKSMVKLYDLIDIMRKEKKSIRASN